MPQTCLYEVPYFLRKKGPTITSSMLINYGLAMAELYFGVVALICSIVSLWIQLLGLYKLSEATGNQQLGMMPSISSLPLVY